MVLGFHFPPPVIEQWNIHKTVEGKQLRRKRKEKPPSSQPCQLNYTKARIQQQIDSGAAGYMHTHEKAHWGGMENNKTCTCLSSALITTCKLQPSLTEWERFQRYEVPVGFTVQAAG